MDAAGCAVAESYTISSSGPMFSPTRLLKLIQIKSEVRRTQVLCVINATKLIWGEIARSPTWARAVMIAVRESCYLSINDVHSIIPLSWTPSRDLCTELLCQWAGCRRHHLVAVPRLCLSVHAPLCSFYRRVERPNEVFQQTLVSAPPNSMGTFQLTMKVDGQSTGPSSDAVLSTVTGWGSL